MSVSCLRGIVLFWTLLSLTNLVLSHSHELMPHFNAHRQVLSEEHLSHPKKPKKRKKRIEMAQPDTSKEYCFKAKRSSKVGLELKKTLLQATEMWSKNNSIVLTGGNWDYRGIVLNWIAHAENIGMTEYVVLCYGKQMYDLVGPWDQGGHGILVRGCESRIEYMFMKILGLFHLVMAKYTVTWSDCDALWLRPAMENWILPQRGKVDILAQKALYPVDISSKFGSAVCTGLFTIYPTDVSINMMKNFLMPAAYDATQKTLKSDQVLINRNLERVGSFRFSGRVELNDTSILVSIPEYQGQLKVPRIGFLSGVLFPRSRSEEDWKSVCKYDPLIWHSITQKNGTRKHGGMQKSGVFALKEGWDMVEKAGDVSILIDHSILLSKGWLKKCK